MLKRVILLFNTVKYLKISQIWNRVKRKVLKSSIDLFNIPEAIHSVNELQSVIQCQKRMYGGDSFKFLNETHDIRVVKDWNSNNLNKLWLYNLHYFDDLNAVNSNQRVTLHHALIQKWIDENPPGFGNGWEPYPSSLRIVNWIKWSLLGGNLKQEWLDSLAVQVRFLNRNLEYHLLGNHLFANAKSLIFAGLYFQGAEAKKWYQTGIKIFNKELQEQILSDGGNFELSPMYHAIFLEDLLDIVNIHQSFNRQAPSKIVSHILSMSNWMRAMCHPDGEVSFFNDSAIGIAPSLKELTSYTERLEISIPNKIDGVVHLQDSGYIRVQKSNLVALIDVANVGPSYIPGHAHADTLSFELSLFGERVIVNSGTSCYVNNQERLRQRGTAAHNTVVINSKNSSEVWDGFRVARRANPFNLHINELADNVSISCSHDGYRRLKGQPIHTRKWVINSNQLDVHDVITGGFQEAEAHYYFHPEVVIKLNVLGNEGVIYLKHKDKIYFEIQSGTVSIVDSTYHPEFGLSIDNKCLVIKFKTNESNIKFYW